MHIYIYIYIHTYSIQFNFIQFNSPSHSFTFTFTLHLHYIQNCTAPYFHNPRIIVHPFWVIPWLPWPSRSSSTGRSNIQNTEAKTRVPSSRCWICRAGWFFWYWEIATTNIKGILEHYFFWTMSHYFTWSVSTHYESIMNPFLIHY